MNTIKKKNIIQLIFAIVGVFLSIFLAVLFQQNILMNLPLAARAILMIVIQWFLATVPIILSILNKDHLTDFGFSKGNILLQVLVGLCIAGIMSLLLTLTPILLGLKDWVSDISYTKLWQFLYEFFYATFGIALAEEFIFRGFFFYKLLKIKESKFFAIVGSSVLFGLFHIFNGNVVQIIMTTLIGIFYCFCREKIKGCSTLSLIIAHGIYDALIVLWVSIL